MVDLFAQLGYSDPSFTNFGEILRDYRIWLFFKVAASCIIPLCFLHDYLGVSNFYINTLSYSFSHVLNPQWSQSFDPPTSMVDLLFCCHLDIAVKMAKMDLEGVQANQKEQNDSQADHH